MENIRSMMVNASVDWNDSTINRILLRMIPKKVENEDLLADCRISYHWSKSDSDGWLWTSQSTNSFLLFNHLGLQRIKEMIDLACLSFIQSILIKQRVKKTWPSEHRTSIFFLESIRSIGSRKTASSEWKPVRETCDEGKFSFLPRFVSYLSRSFSIETMLTSALTTISFIRTLSPSLCLVLPTLKIGLLSDEERHQHRILSRTYY